MKLATLTLDCDRFDYIEAAYLFWTEHHSGQFSDGYIKLCSYTEKYKFSPSSSFDYPSLSDSSKIIYGALCEKEKVENQYNTLTYLLNSDDSHFDIQDSCVSFVIGRYDDEYTTLENYETSDFVNIDMCYTSELIQFYDDNESEILDLIDQTCDAFGYNSRMQLLESDTIETPDDMKAAMVNHAMTYLCRDIYQWLQNQGIV